MDFQQLHLEHEIKGKNLVISEKEKQQAENRSKKIIAGTFFFQYPIMNLRILIYKDFTQTIDQKEAELIELKKKLQDGIIYFSSNHSFSDAFSEY